MNNQENNVILSKEDYRSITQHVTPSDQTDNTMSLAYELSRASVVEKDQVPGDRVRLNAWVEIEDLDSKIKTRLTIVDPSGADMKQQKVSFLTPIGSALIGFKVGDQVEWKMPAGLKKYKILAVEQLN